VHDWRTRQDPFAGVCERLWVLLAIDPERTAKDLLSQLQLEQPDRFTAGQLRTLQRRVRLWRREQASCESNGHAITLNNQES
jgi:DNA-binding IclR family transcriptional regulator